MLKQFSIASMLIVAAATSSGAQTKPLDRAQPWAQACEEAITKRIQQETKSPRVQYTADTENQWPVSATEMGVRGDGEYQMPSGGVQPFQFECRYDTKAGKLSNARYTLR